MEATMRPIVMLAVPVLLFSAQTAGAQTGTGSQPAPASPCQAEPDANTNTGNDNGGAGASAGQGNRSGGLSGKLDPCNGVLKPPPTGDEGMTEPAPDQGKTPIIKPGQVRPQAPKQ
jgi:hypothetical protein